MDVQTSSAGKTISFPVHSAITCWMLCFLFASLHAQRKRKRIIKEWQYALPSFLAIFKSMMFCFAIFLKKFSDAKLYIIIVCYKKILFVFHKQFGCIAQVVLYQKYSYICRHIFTYKKFKTMDEGTVYSPKVHHGHNIKRLRALLHIKQEALAVEFGISQQAVAKLEKKAVISDEILERVAKVLNIPVDAIKNFNDEIAVNVISNTFNDTFHDHSSFVIGNQSNVNQIDKLIETLERLLKAEQEKNALLEKLLEEKNNAKTSGRVHRSLLFGQKNHRNTVHS